MRKKFSLFMLFVLFVFQSTEVFATSKTIPLDYQQNLTQKGGSDNVIPYKDIIGWRYKTINGVVHKRQYNYSTEQWIGSWQPM